MIYQEKIFTKEECNKILSYTKIYTDLPFRKLESRLDLDNRRINEFVEMKNGKKLGKFFNVWDIVNDAETEWMFEKLFNWFLMVSKIERNPNNKPAGCSLHKYSKGDSFMKHKDYNEKWPNRRWNLGIQLNENYSGGEYICYDTNDKEILLSKEVGTAIAYDASTFHEIKEIVDGERWSIVLTILKRDILEKMYII